jgi:flagellar biosynthesis protein FlhF
LRYGDFDDNFIDSFINEVSTNVALKNIKNIDEIFRNENLFEEVKRLLSNYVKRKVLTFNGIEVNRGRSKAITFIGPTGEGKTTTLVKLACGYLIEDKCELKIISLDYYRIAAKEQLNYYADVLMQPFEFYNDIDIFRKECDLTGKDVILIDTAGRGQKDHKELLELKKYLNLVHIDLVKCLVLSATKKYYDMKEIIRNFDEEIGIDNIILTKIDETNSLGQALSVLAETGKPLTYITDGQAVPENIHKADINGLININFTKMLDRYKDTW